MEQSITIKAKLLNIDNETAQAFVQSMEKYKDACNLAGISKERWRKNNETRKYRTD